MDKAKRKKGGAEKLRAKRAKNLAIDAAKCVKITDMFTGGAAVASTSSVTAVQGEDSSSGQGEIFDRETEGESERECVAQPVSSLVKTILGDGGNVSCSIT